MTKIDRQRIKYSIESIEFHSRGLMECTGSQVRVSRFVVSEKRGIATADLNVYYNGVEVPVKKQVYILDGLSMWVNSLIPQYI